MVNRVPHLGDLTCGLWHRAGIAIRFFPVEVIGSVGFSALLNITWLIWGIIMTRTQTLVPYPRVLWYIWGCRLGICSSFKALGKMLLSSTWVLCNWVIDPKSEIFRKGDATWFLFVFGAKIFSHIWQLCFFFFSCWNLKPASVLSLEAQSQFWSHSVWFPKW